MTNKKGLGKAHTLPRPKEAIKYQIVQNNNIEGCPVLPDAFGYFVLGARSQLFAPNEAFQGDYHI